MPYSTEYRELIEAARDAMDDREEQCLMPSENTGSTLVPAPTVVALHQVQADELLTKKELAATLGRSERWIELRQRDSGLPVADTDRFGRRRYRLSDVDAWLHEHSKPRTAAERISELEAKVRQLTVVVEELQSQLRSTDGETER